MNPQSWIYKILSIKKLKIGWFVKKNNSYSGIFWEDQNECKRQKNSGFIDSRLGVPSDEADKIFAKFVN